MDILISSNLERLLYLVCGAEKTAAYMKQLNETGKYTLADDEIAKIQETFVGYYASEEDTAESIRSTFEKYNYLCDTHTAVGYHAARAYIAETDCRRRIVLASTASPYKFAAAVYRALTGKDAAGDIEALDELRAFTGVEIPAPLADVAKRTVRFETVMDAKDMPASVIEFAKK